ncbi:hypothetical protein KJ830_02250 [bacterium]|nr:hypothetical protein [Patescibacteria group bacterium]MBU4509849.1 hypothetical protein [bacterium]
MKFTISKEIKHAILIDENSLNDLFKFISEKYEKVEIIAKCNDGSLLETKDIKEILSFENPNYRKIISITITGRNSPEEKLSFSIINKFPPYPISLDFPFGGPSTAECTIVSEKEEIAKFNSDKLKQMLLELKPSFFYDFLARISLLSIIALFWGTTSMIYWVKVFFGIIPKTSSNFSGIEAFSFIVILIIALIVITYPFDLLRQWLFPKVFLLLGKQKKNMKTIQNYRTIIFVVLILGMVISIAAGLLLRKI